ncbi:MAG: response regulator, partial [Bacteroidota bacterium]
TENPCVSGSIPLITTKVSRPLPMMKNAEKPFKFDRVLLIDDNDIDNFINERMITTSHFSKSVVVKNSGEGALSFLSENAADNAKLPEVIFLDLNMPAMDGFGFLAEYEKLPESIRKFCKVVVLSSSISPEDINRASMNPYVLKYVNKPLGEKYLDAINF